MRSQIGTAHCTSKRGQHAGAKADDLPTKILPGNSEFIRADKPLPIHPRSVPPTQSPIAPLTPAGLPFGFVRSILATEILTRLAIGGRLTIAPLSQTKVLARGAIRWEVEFDGDCLDVRFFDQILNERFMGSYIPLLG